jgi:hypothetical protein
MTVESTGRLALITGWVFAAAFFVGLILVGDQAGAFADSDRAYAELFGDVSHRLEDLAGSALLIVAGIAFGAFSHLVAPALRPDEDRYGWTVVVRVSGLLAAASILVAGAAFATVPASLVIGDFFDDPGIVTGQNILPSLGYILLVLGALIPAAVVMVGSTRLDLFPRWFVWVTLVVAVVLIVTGPMVSALVLLPIWVAGAAVLQYRSKQRSTQYPTSVTGRP